jgi:hypothetical protein
MWYEDFNNRRFITDLRESPKLVEGLVLIYSSFAFAPGNGFCSCNGLDAFKERPFLLFELPLVLTRVGRVHVTPEAMLQPSLIRLCSDGITTKSLFPIGGTL